MPRAWLALLCTACLPATLVAENERANYLLACRGCHLADGRGVPPEVPSLRDTLGELAATTEGRNYLVRVPAVLQSPLADEELAAVLNWVLKEYNGKSLPENFTPFTAEEVRTARLEILPDPLRYRRELPPVQSGRQ